jgi:pimeloyl-ACP methyl ester carboxylesterase
MAKGENKHLEDSGDRLVVAAQSAGAVFAAVGAAVGGWIGYSALRINHRAPLPEALNAERRMFVSPHAGRISYYVDRSSGAGTPLVLLHSINAAASAYEMRPLFEHYRHERPVYAVDLPGFGFSDRSNRAYTPRLYIDAIIEMIESQVRNGPADVIALSLTGEFAASAALERPDLFHSLTLISPSGFSAPDNENGTQKAGRNSTSDRLYKGFSFPLWSQAFYDLIASPLSIKYFLKKSFVGPVDTGLIDYSYATSHQPGARFAPLHFISGKLFTPDIAERVYEKLELPVVAIYDEDSFVTFERLPEVIMPRPNWHAERITPTRGLPQWEQLDATARAIDSVLGPSSLDQPESQRSENRSNRRLA